MRRIRHLFLMTMMCCSVFSTLAQTKTIRGRVISSDGMPVAGATVRIAPSNQGASTDNDGMFQLSYEGDEATLTVSAIGFAEVKVAVGNQQTIEVVLETSMSELQEVQVINTAYGTTDRKTFTGAATVVSGEKLQKIQSTNVGQALQGVSSGVQVLNTNGQPGANANILIRGLSSIGGNNSPLILLDGMPFEGSLNSINPTDIESMTILKDAAATSLYGSRAANGIVVITTKSGSSGGSIVNFRANYGMSDMAVAFPNRVNAQEIFELGWEAIRNGRLDEGDSPEAAAQYATDNVVSRYFQDINRNVFDNPYPIGIDGKLKSGVNQLYVGDWFNELYKPAVQQDYSIDFGGTIGQENKTRYFVSGSYLNDKGNFTVQKFERFSARINLESDIKKWLTVGSNVTYSHSFQQYPSAETRFLRVMPEVYPVYVWDYERNEYGRDQYGNLMPDYGDYSRTEWRGWNNAFVGDYKNEYDWNFTGYRADNLSTRNFVEVRFIPQLKLRSSISTDYRLNYDHSYQSATMTYSAGYGGWSSRSANRMFSYTFNNILTYDQTFGKHSVNVMAGQEAYRYQYNTLSASREGFPLGGLYELSAAARITGASSNEDHFRILSFLSKADYNFDRKYYLSASFRTDGASRFHRDNRWGEFWSLGASWILSEEEFMESASWVDNLKLRGSYGTVGNDKVSAGYYAYQGLYNTGWNDWDRAGAILSRLPTPNLIWESSQQFDIGVDFSFLGRFHGSVDWFNRKSKDLIFYRPLPPSVGIGGIDENIGDVRNYGLELELSAQILRSSAFKWNIDLNWSKYKNEITKLPQDEVYSSRFKWTEGVSMYEFFGPVWAGVNPETGNNSWYKFTENGREVTENYSDVNRNDQMQYLGTSIPDYFGAVTNNFSYKGIDLSVMLYYSVGGKMYDGDYLEGVTWRRGFSMSKDILDRWTPENRMTDIPRLSEYSQNNTRSYSSQYLFDNSFLRLRNVMLGYTLPASLANSMKLGSIRVFVRGDNLLTWGQAARRGTDPETTINGLVGNGANGSAAAPIRRNYGFGLQLSF